MDQKIKHHGIHWTTLGFIAETKKFLTHNNALLIGDLNSNTIWDGHHKEWSHTTTVKELNKIGLRSLYHEKYGASQGCEKHPTLFMFRHLNKPYHIDYMFSGSGWNLVDITVGKYTDWINLSDHMPIYSEIKAR